MSPCNAEPGIDSSSRVPGFRGASGFSLLELVVVMAILAIVAVMAMPALSSVVNSNRLAAQSNDLVASLQLARSEAVRRNARVTLCPSADGLTCDVAAAPGVAWEGWITVVDSDSEVLRSSVVKAPVQVTSAVAAITFRADGLARQAGGGLLATTLTACIPTQEPPENRRVISIASGSRVSIARLNGAGDCTD